MDLLRRIYWLLFISVIPFPHDVTVTSSPFATLLNHVFVFQECCRRYIWSLHNFLFLYQPPRKNSWQFFKALPPPILSSFTIENLQPASLLAVIKFKGSSYECMFHEWELLTNVPLSFIHCLWFSTPDYPKVSSMTTKKHEVYSKIFQGFTYIS